MSSPLTVSPPGVPCPFPPQLSEFHIPPFSPSLLVTCQPSLATILHFSCPYSAPSFQFFQRVSFSLVRDPHFAFRLLIQLSVVRVQLSEEITAAATPPPPITASASEAPYRTVGK